ncbi:MAG: helix-turn-helix domain-containing protein, partial [Thermoanaerobaculia bacterium]
MRATTLLRRWIGVTALFVRDVWWSGDGEVSVEVRPRWRRPRCGRCGKRAPGFDRRPARRWRHLPWGRTAVWLVYAPRRVSCRRCGVRTEQVPWAEAGGRATSALEELVAYLAQGSDFTRVSRLMGISWSTVRSIVERV